MFDHGYDGTGNWAFNTAYAASRTGAAFVTRLRDLTEVEQLVAAGIPVVASIAFGRYQLSGAPISSSSGHLLVIVGFTSTGDVVVNDPAAPIERDRAPHVLPRPARAGLARRVRRHGVRRPRRGPSPAAHPRHLVTGSALRSR